MAIPQRMDDKFAREQQYRDHRSQGLQAAMEGGRIPTWLAKARDKMHTLSMVPVDGHGTNGQPLVVEYEQHANYVLFVPGDGNFNDVGLVKLLKGNPNDGTLPILDGQMIRPHIPYEIPQGGIYSKGERRYIQVWYGKG